MILGVSYNLFDGEELLEKSIKSIRNNVDYVSVIYQNISNYGNANNINLEDFLMELKNQQLIDEIYLYDPIIGSGHINETKKRNIGLNMCKILGCTHHMTMDADEFYLDNEFKNIKNLIITENYHTTACQMLTYYKDSSHIIDPPETYYVPFIYKIDNRQFNYGIKWPILADPTRKMNPNNFKAFDRNDIQMHHMSYVRKNINKKLINSSANLNFKHKIDKIVNHWNNWTDDLPALLAGKEDRFYNTKIVKDLFKISF